jgi:hypothetical protein
MAAPTLIGSWNLFMGGSHEGKVSVRNATCEITAADDGRLKLEISTGANFRMLPSENSGYSAATGSSPNYSSKNFLVLVLSRDGSTFHGGFRSGETAVPEAWWGERQ